MKFESRYSNHPNEVKKFDTKQLRDTFLIEEIFIKDEISLTYSHNDRIIAGGAYPVTKELALEATADIAAKYFLERRELGVINIGGDGYIILDGVKQVMNARDGIYVGLGVKDVVFGSIDAKNPAKFYINSTPAHKTYPTYHIPFEKSNPRPLGDPKLLNSRTIHQYIHPAVCKSCQLSMGLTVLNEGSGWNTMPCHTHDRRMEVYLYFNIPADNVVFHLMGQKDETRHLVVQNEQAVISPSWSIHSGMGTTNYAFIWGMAGENQDFDDMDFIKTTELK